MALFVQSVDGVTPGDVRGSLPTRFTKRLSDGAWSIPTAGTAQDFGWFSVTETAAPSPDHARSVVHDGSGFVTEWTLDAAAQAARLEREANEADKAARIQALAVKSVSALEASAAQIDARAATYEAFPDVASNGEALTRINVMTDDVAALARRVADLQQTVAHLIRVTVIGQ